MIDFKKFDTVFRVVGIDLTKFTEFIDFTLDTSYLVSMNFKPEEDITNNTVVNYLQLTPKFVNNFNHFFDHFIMGVEEIKEVSNEYVKTLKLMKETDDDV